MIHCRNGRKAKNCGVALTNGRYALGYRRLVETTSIVLGYVLAASPLVAKSFGYGLGMYGQSDLIDEGASLKWLSSRLSISHGFACW